MSNLHKNPLEANERLKMDEMAIRCLEILEEIIQQRALLDDVMKNGFIYMAQARYNMGKNSVSFLQLPTEDCNVDAQIRVSSDFNINNGLVDYKQFSVISSSSENDQSEEIVRRRNKEISAENDSNKLNDLEKDQNGKKKKEKKNPLNWFGILVPQALKACQSDFKKTLGILCNIANLQNELFETSQKFKEIRLENKLKELSISSEQAPEEILH